MNGHSIQDLRMLQALPLELKVRRTKQRLREWVGMFGADGVYISFSGGKDSTVLLNIAREEFPEIPAVFCDVPTQFPELRTFAESFDNVTVVRPKISFSQVCEKYGFPLISKEVSETVYEARNYIKRVLDEENQTERTVAPQALNKLIGAGRYGGEMNTELLEKTISNKQVQKVMGVLKSTGKATLEDLNDAANLSPYNCSRYQFFLGAPFEISDRCCRIMKKSPMKKYERETGRAPIIATMAQESRLRTQAWLKNGCNAFEAKHKVSNPMSFWTEQDVLLYIYKNKLPICSVYGDVVKETEVEGQLDFEDLGIFDLGTPILKTTGWKRTGCMLCGFGAHLDEMGGGVSRFVMLKESHPKMHRLLYTLKNSGVTFAEAIDWTNENGNLNIRY